MNRNKSLIRAFAILFFITFIIFEALALLISKNRLESIQIALAVLLVSLIFSLALLVALTYWHLHIGNESALLISAFFIIGMTVGIIGLFIWGIPKDNRSISLFPFLISGLLTAIYKLDFIRRNSTEAIRAERKKSKQKKDKLKIVI